MEYQQQWFREKEIPKLSWTARMFWTARSSPTTSVLWAGLNKKVGGNLTITDETSDTGETITAKDETDTSGSLRAESGKSLQVQQLLAETADQATDNITIEGYATVKKQTHCFTMGRHRRRQWRRKGSNITIIRAMPMLRQTADGPELVSAADPEVVIMVEEMRKTSPFETMPK